MMDRTVEASPHPRARITGVVYLLYFLTAALAVFFIGGLVVSGEAAATANNILAREIVSVECGGRSHRDCFVHRCNGSLLWLV